MVFIDTNIILRYLLQDNESQFLEAKKIIENSNVFIINEVFIEVIYVLTKTYKVDKKLLSGVLIEFIKTENVSFNSKEIIINALNTFTDTSLDFVDCILYAMHTINHEEIFTFDEKLISLMRRKRNNI